MSSHFIFFFCNEFYKFNDAGHMLIWRENIKIVQSLMQFSLHNFTRSVKPAIGLSMLLHGVIIYHPRTRRNLINTFII